MALPIALINGALAPNAGYTNAQEITSKVERIYDLVDIDTNGKTDALTDGLLLLRQMFGLTGDGLVGGAIAADALYSSSTNIEGRITMLGSLADIDGNGSADALTDGLLALRYLFGLKGDALISGVIAADATRASSAEVEAHIQSLTPAL